MIPNTDQWLLGGKCKDCRRRPYCKKPCTANKRKIRELIQQEIVKKIATGGDSNGN